MPVTTGIGLAVTTINICASNCALAKFQDVWDREVEHIPTNRGITQAQKLYLFYSYFLKCRDDCCSF